MQSLTPFIRRQPAPDKDESGVLQLVEWREEAPYG